MEEDTPSDEHTRSQENKNGRTVTPQAIAASLQDTDMEPHGGKHNETAACLLTSTKPAEISGSFTYRDDEEMNELQHYHCDSCQRDITNTFRVRCGECLDFDLCSDCFVNGVEAGTHRNDHSYIPIGGNDFCIFTQGWNADEEMILLEGVSKFGFGNWAEIAELVSRCSTIPKTKQNCEEHYYTVHILPSKEEKSNTIPEIEDEELRRVEYQKRLIGKYYPTSTRPVKSSAYQNTLCNIVGYMPLRGDFDVEYDNDAELILADIEFREDEIPVERELKLKVIDIYNARVDERILRKRVVTEKGLVDWRRTQNSSRKKAKEEIDFINLFRLLVRYDLEPDYEEFSLLYLNERKLRQRIQILNQWRAMGFQTFKDVEAYEKLKALNVNGCIPAQNSISSPESETKITSTSGNIQTDTTNSQTTVSKPEISHQLEAPAAQYPGAKLLTEAEIDFCDKLQIPPAYFIMTKYSLLNALIQQNNADSLQGLSTLKLDATREGSLYDFVLHTKVDLADPPDLPAYSVSLNDVPPSEQNDFNSKEGTLRRKTRQRYSNQIVEKNNIK